MLLQINDHLSIEEVQERFMDCYPFLRINFYALPHKSDTSVAGLHALDKKQKIGDVRSFHRNGLLEIKSWHKVAFVEKRLKEEFGLTATLSRRAPGTSWVETFQSGDLTLAEQTALGYTEERLSKRKMIL